MAVPELPAESGWYRLTGHGWERVDDDVAEAEVNTPLGGLDLVHVRSAATAETPLFREAGTMTTLQAWILIVEVGIIALAYFVGLFRGRAA